MERIWFRKTMNGLCWKPITWEGWVVSALWGLANGWYFARIDNVSHSMSDTLIAFAPFFIVSTGILLFVIYRSCDRNWE